MSSCGAMFGRHPMLESRPSIGPTPLEVAQRRVDWREEQIRMHPNSWDKNRYTWPSVDSEPPRPTTPKPWMSLSRMQDYEMRKRTDSMMKMAYQIAERQQKE